MTQRTLAYADQQERDGRDLRARREELSLTQREVAALVGVSNVAISLLERGYASQAMRRRVREALDTYTAAPTNEEGGMSETTKVPMDARTERAICALSHDNVCQGDFSILIDGDTIYLTEQALGEYPRQEIEIPRKAFDAFVAWYTTGKVPRGDKASRTPPKERADAVR